MCVCECALVCESAQDQEPTYLHVVCLLPWAFSPPNTHLGRNKIERHRASGRFARGWCARGCAAGRVGGAGTRCSVVYELSRTLAAQRVRHKPQRRARHAILAARLPGCPPGRQAALRKMKLLSISVRPGSRPGMAAVSLCLSFAGSTHTPPAIAPATVDTHFFFILYIYIPYLFFSSPFLSLPHFFSPLVLLLAGVSGGSFFEGRALLLIRGMRCLLAIRQEIWPSV